LNTEKYNRVFMETFHIDDEQLLPEYTFKVSPNWDSVGQMMLCSAIEDAFEVRLDGEDILNITSYQEGKKTLAKYGIEI